MRKVALGLGLLWMGLVVVFAIALGLTGGFVGGGGIMLGSDYGDIWILTMCVLPGYFIWKWGNSLKEDGEE